MDEIQKKYNGQWIYMINLIEDERGQVIGGEVAAASDSRKKILQEMLHSDNDSIYILYAGEMPAGIGGILL